MSFQETLNDYLSRLNCSGRDLAAASGVSEAVISRYRSGARVPDADGAHLSRITEALVLLAAERGLDDLDRETVGSAFRQALSAADAAPDREQFRKNLNALLDAFSVSSNELARFVNFDASHLSRIRSGQRMPRDPALFSENVARYLLRRFRSAEEWDRLSALTGGTVSLESSSEDNVRAVIRYLLSSAGPETPGNLGQFLQKLDEFDLDEYIRVIRFNEMRLPTAPIQFPASRVYTGLKELMNAQLDFLRTTVLSRSRMPVTLYSDMPMTEMSQDLEFPKKWMFGMAAMLKKGLRLHMIHNLDRPFAEMMLGLESYIPMYMTGQISPYYLTGAQSSPFRHMLWVSGSAALVGECVTGHIRDGKIYLTNRKQELSHYQKWASQLLKRASPFMEIYREDRRSEFENFMKEDRENPGSRQSLLSSLPVFTLSDALVRSILDRCGIRGAERQSIEDYIRSERERMEHILTHSAVSDVLPEIPEAEYAEYPMSLPLAGMFYSGDIRLTYEEYLAHLDLCDAYASQHPGYACRRDKNVPFRNIQITILENRYVHLAKGKSPVIHFVIRHPKMIDAIQNMAMPITD